jgi:nucleotide-binding universal stress UspA family protein
MTENVLVPIDGSPLSHEALRHALEAFPDTGVTVLYVIDLFGSDAGGEIGSAYEPLMGSDEWYGQAEERAEELLDEAEAIAEEHGRDVATVSEIGTPERIIVDFAGEEDIDHVVLGTHGRGDEDRPLYGSTAETVARRAPVPVTIVR